GPRPGVDVGAQVPLAQRQRHPLAFDRRLEIAGGPQRRQQRALAVAYHFATVWLAEQIAQRVLELARGDAGGAGHGDDPHPLRLAFADLGVKLALAPPLADPAPPPTRG